MFKKIIVAGATAGLLLVSVSGAFAQSLINISNERTTVGNTVNTNSNTGGNSIGYNAEDEVTNNGINTGSSLSLASVTNQVNYNHVTTKLDLSWESNYQLLNLENEDTQVWNTVNTNSNTGGNSIGYNADEEVTGNQINTGASLSQSVLTNVVNTNVVKTTLSFSD